MKRFIALISVFILIMTFASCKDKEVSHKTGWQNPQAPSSEEWTSEEETMTDELTTEAAATEEKEIEFNKKKALEAGTFESEIYGKLTVYFQDEHFILNDEYGDKVFTVFAEGYSASKTDGKPVFISSDMNYDGYNDFGVCYYKDTLNSYYFCFLWDSSSRTFSYYLPLSSLANPEFDAQKKNVTAFEKLTTARTVEKTYRYSENELILVNSKEVTAEPETNGAETVNADLQVTLNGNSALLILRAGENSHSKWVCTVEDENIAVMSSEYYDENANAYEFLISAVSPGATTVIFRYTAVGSGDYIEEVIVNAITNTDSTISIVVPE